jgi:hypothetical protein
MDQMQLARAAAEELGPEISKIADSLTPGVEHTRSFASPEAVAVYTLVAQLAALALQAHQVGLDRKSVRAKLLDSLPDRSRTIEHKRIAIIDIIVNKLFGR